MCSVHPKLMCCRCAGYAAKSAGKFAVTIAGAGFLALQACTHVPPSPAHTAQLAAYNGYVTVHWGKLERDAVSLLDANGDGEVGGSMWCIARVVLMAAGRCGGPADALGQGAAARRRPCPLTPVQVMRVLKYNLPSSSGFVAGLLLGLRA